jgi:HupE / UreJ protein
LTIYFSFKEWKNVVWLVTAFTIGHTFSLILSAYEIIYVKMKIAEFLIPLTILVTAGYNIFSIKSTRKSIVFTSIVALIFGLIHGFGFSSYFKIMVDDTEDKLIPLIEFAIGIEIAQLLIVLFILILNFLILSVLKKSKRDWILVISSVVIGVIIPMLIERKFW